MKQLWLLICCISLSINIYAQETIVVGEVYDATTGEPLSNVNIYLQGTQTGTTTNTEGLFIIREDLNHSRTLVVSSVGYHTERFKIEPHSQVGIDVALKEKVGNLGDVFITPQENPALPLMEKVRARRESNRQSTSTLSANKETVLYVSDIQSKHLKRALWKNLQSGMIQQPDSTYLIPLYWQQQQGENIRQEATLLTLTDYQIIMEQIPETFDFYDNTMPFLSTSILSPLAASGNTYYKYYLVDSMFVGHEKHYLLHFKTKNPFYATFNGEMRIDSASCALRHIKVNLPTQTNINYLKELAISQTYNSNNQLVDEQTNALLDFAIKTKNDTAHIFPTLLLTRNFNGYQSLDTTHQHTTSQLPLSESLILPALDSLNNTSLFKAAKLIAYVIQTGCIPTGKYVEIGKVHHVFKLNQQEGLRVGIPFRTTEELWKNVCLEAMVAYGFGDRAWKGMGQISIALPTERRHIVELKYNDAYTNSEITDMQENIQENTVFNRQTYLLTSLMGAFKANPEYYYNTATRRQEGRVSFQDDWNNYLETQSYIKIGQVGYSEPTRDYDGQQKIFYSTLGTMARISFNERKVDSYFHRRHVYNDLPVIYLGAEFGSYHMEQLPSYRLHGNLQLMLRHQIDLGMGGELDYLLEAGMIFGKVPYPLLHIFAGNQTHAFDTHRFSLINDYQYAADQYIALHAHWDGKGVLFNMIPGVRYARLRELAEVKLAYGGLRQDHQSILAFPTTKTGHSTLHAPTIPYIEVGVGVGNILRIGEIYGVFRLTHLQDTSTPWWAIRFRLHLGM